VPFPQRENTYNTVITKTAEGAKSKTIKEKNKVSVTNSVNLRDRTKQNLELLK